MTRRSALGLAGAGAVTLMAGSSAQAQTGGEAVVGHAGGDTLHVTTFNIRLDTKAAPGTPDSWTDRRPVLARFLEIEQPTVLGIQEGLYHQVKEIATDLPKHYEWIGLGREGGGRGEFMTIYYDTRRVQPLDFDHFWLSDTPYVIGSKSWGNNVVRMVTWVRFRDDRTGKEFVHVNTHFDHQSENARQRSAILVRDRIAGFDPALPVVLTGDFNTPADSVSYRTLTESGLADTWRTAAKQLTPEWGTFPNYRDPVLGANRIDWVLANQRVSVLAAAINTFRVDGRYPSDHVPVQALVRLL